MKAKLKINQPLPAERREAIRRALATAAALLERLIKETIANSTPAGRTYRRSAVYRKGTIRDRKTNREKFKNKFFKLNDERFAVAYNFHRASRKGQPPAIDSGRLINSIRARYVTQFRYRVGTSVVYAIYLDSPKYLDRPFFISVAKEFKPIFLEMIRKAFIEAI